MAMTLKERRRYMGFSQNTVAKKLGVSIGTVNNWEDNPEKVAIGKALKLAELYECSIDDLIFLPDNATKM